jgi:hypothetical protein
MPVPLPPIARLGIAAGILGLPVAPAGAFLNSFVPELQRRMCVRIGDAGRSLTVGTRGAGPDFVARAKQLVAHAEPARGAALGILLDGSQGPTTLEVGLGSGDVEIAIEQVLGGPVGAVFEALGAGAQPLLPVDEARDLAATAALLRENLDAVGWARRDGNPIVHAVFAAADPETLRPGTLEVLEALGVPAQQRDFATGTFRVLTASAGVVVRVGAGAGGVDRVAIEYRNVAPDNALKIWQTLAPSPGFPARFGSLVGALGSEIVAALEVTYVRDGSHLLATFEIATEPVTLPLRRA